MLQQGDIVLEHTVEELSRTAPFEDVLVCGDEMTALHRCRFILCTGL